MKRCSVCNLEKDESDFYVTKSKQCKICKIAYNKKRVASKWEEVYRKKREWRKNNLNRCLEKEKAWRDNPENKKKSEETRKIWLSKNKERYKANRNARLKIRRKTDPIFNLGQNLRKSLIRSIQKSSKKSSALNLLGCSLEDFKKYIETKFTEGMSWENWGWGDNFWNIDHIVPISSFGLDDYEQQKICFHYTNLQPLWQIDNFLKSDKIIIDGKEIRVRNTKR